ncbi:MAG: glycosyltransferase [Bacteroidales bacterium]|nr:glycosyltransferase [Bacteroidales bacterium]
MKTVHITTVHQRFDSRIFYKECLSLNEEFGDVTLIVADGKGDETVKGINIIDIGAFNSRIKRLLFASKRAVNKAASLKADIYHFHDPDLLIAAGKLCKYGKVIFDSHEDFPKLMLQRPYIPKILRNAFFRIATFAEKRTYKKLAAVVAATDNIKRKFEDYGQNKAVAVKNYPVIHVVNSSTHTDVQDHPFTACYVGGLTEIRGVREMITVCGQADCKLILAGPFDDETFFRQMQTLPGWKNTEYLGTVPHGELKEKVYRKSDIGLNMLLSAPNHTDAIPIKQLEYMSEELPVVATEHIKFCVEVTQKTHCGILVKPENIEECVRAVKFLKDNKQERTQMGINGKKAVKEEYNWDKEKEKLISLYKKLQNQVI